MNDRGKASKKAIEGVINDIDVYSKFIEGELSLIKEKVGNLSEYWKDKKFKDFMNCVERMKHNVEKNLNQIQEAQYNLIEIVGKM